MKMTDSLSKMAQVYHNQSTLPQPQDKCLSCNQPTQLLSFSPLHITFNLHITLRIQELNLDLAEPRRNLQLEAVKYITEVNIRRIYLSLFSCLYLLTQEIYYPPPGSQTGNCQSTYYISLDEHTLTLIEKQDMFQESPSST